VLLFLKFGQFVFLRKLKGLDINLIFEAYPRSMEEEKQRIQRRRSTDVRRLAEVFMAKARRQWPDLAALESHPFIFENYDITCDEKYPGSNRFPPPKRAYIIAFRPRFTKLWHVDFDPSRVSCVDGNMVFGVIPDEYGHNLNEILNSGGRISLQDLLIRAAEARHVMADILSFDIALFSGRHPNSSTCPLSYDVLSLIRRRLTISA
jgi:hypothetical protein